MGDQPAAGAYYADRNMGRVFDAPHDPGWWLKSKYREALDRFQPERFAKRVLDLGCGLGQAAWFLSKRFESVTALDLSADAIAFARKHYEEPNLEFLCMDLLEYEPEEPFDLIFCMDVIEHLDPNAASAFMPRLGALLRPEGALIAHVPIAETPAGRRKRARYIRRHQLETNPPLDHTGDPTHAATFSPASFRALVGTAGLEIEAEWPKLHAWRPIRGLVRALLERSFAPATWRDAATYSLTVLARRR